MSNTSDTHRITALENRIATLEMLINDVMHAIDKPDTQPKSKTKSRSPSGQKKRKDTPKKKKDKPKPTPPSEIVASLLKEKSLTQDEIESATSMDTEAVSKCLRWMKQKCFIEKQPDRTYQLDEQKWASREQ